MADLSDLLSGLFNGGSSTPASAPAPAPASGVQDSGVRALNNSVAQDNVLARLRTPGSSNLSSIGGAAGAGMAGVKTDGSKFGAFAQGLAGGMKASAEQKAAQQKANLELMKAYWDRDYKQAELKIKNDTLTETANAHKALAKYYEGMVANGARDKTDTVNDLYKTELARTNAANRFGLKDPTLNKIANGDIAAGGGDPAAQAKAQAELDRRQKMFDAWDAKQAWSKDGKLPAPGTTPLPALPVDPNAPVAPKADDEEGDENNSTPTPATPAPDTQKGGPPGPMASNGTFRPRPYTASDGTTKMVLFNDKTGETQPMPDASTPPGPPSPPGVDPGQTLPGFGG